MSSDFEGPIDYARIKRHYDNDDYVALSFTTNQDYYTIGTQAYLSNQNLPTTNPGWIVFASLQPAVPSWFATAYSGVPWPGSGVPAFEEKTIMFYASAACYVRFAGSTNVQHLIPANTYMIFHRRCFMFFFQGVSTTGTLNVWIQG
jgi:hypothetical protein